MPTQNMLRLWLLLMLMLRNVLTREKMKLSQYFAADHWLWLWRLFLVENLDSRFWSYVWSRFWSLCLVEMLIIGCGFEAAWSRLWRWNLIKICLRTCYMTFKEVTLVTRTQPLGPFTFGNVFLLNPSLIVIVKGILRALEICNQFQLVWLNASVKDCL